MKTKFLCGLLLLASACSGTQSKGDVGLTNNLQLKKAAAEAARPGGVGSSNDVCQSHAWYGDGVCDTFCVQHDSDCVSNGEKTVCAAFIELGDSTCGRAENDVCRFQDPDCGAAIPPKSGTDDVCAAFEEQSNGACARPDSDPCRFQDPDCLLGGIGNGGSGGSGGSGEPGPQCPAVSEQPNGKCELPASDPCRSLDPDCNVACAEFIEQPDGVCRRDANDPCIFQDPDCKVK